MMTFKRETPRPSRPSRLWHSLRGALAALTLLAGCATTTSSGAGASESPSASPSAVTSRVVQTGKLRVGMSGDQPPLNLRGKSGQMIGLEVDLAQALAMALGVELEIVQKPFGQLLDTLKAGEVDMVLSGVDITLDRAEDFFFVGPYLLSGKSLVTTSEALAKAETIHDVNLETVTFVALENSTSAAFVSKFAPKAKLVTVDTYETAVAKVLDGSASAMIADRAACMLALLKNPQAGLVTLVEPLSVEPLGIAVTAEDAHFHHLIENYVEAFEKTGILDELRQRWTEDPSWLSELP